MRIGDNLLRKLPKWIVIKAIIFILLCLMTGIVIGQYKDSLKEEHVYEYWSGTSVKEYNYISVKDGEIKQYFTAEQDVMTKFVLSFYDFSAKDEASLYVSLEDMQGECYYSWTEKTANFGNEAFHLVGAPEKLKEGKEYCFRIWLDGDKSDITVRARYGEGTHETIGKLTIAEEVVEDTVLFFSQKYSTYSSYATLWLWMLLISLGVFLCIVLIKREWFLDIWRVLSVLLLITVGYYNIENLSGNLSSVAVKNMVINWLLLLGLYLILRAIFLRKAYYLTAIVFLIMGLANYYVLQFRGTELLFSDIKSFSTAMSVVGNYEFTVPPLVFSSILITLCLLFVQGAADVRGQTGYHKAKMWARGVQAVCGIVLFVLISISVTYSVKKEAFNFFTLSANFAKYGWCYANVFIAKLSAIEKPDGYSDKQVEKIISGMEQLSDEETEDVTPENHNVIPKNLIVIMNESFSDLSVIGELSTNQDYMPFIRSLQENTVKGNLHVSTFGGTTCITEYEFLTGNTEAFLPTGCVPYSGVCEESEEGVVKTLQAQGYHAVAMHPYGASNWNRDKVYPALGFDEFLSEEDYKGYETLRNYVSDKGDYQKIIDYYEAFEQDKKLFVFNVTMQNHGGYDVNNGVMDTAIEIENIDNSVAETYLSLIYESDKAFEYLVSYFEQVEEPTMIVMFGDHLPALPDSFYSALYGKALSERTAWDLTRELITPYVIWTNYDSDFEEIPDISANYLGSYVLQCAGVELPTYNKFLLEHRKQVPIMGKRGVYDTEGQYILYKDLPDSVLRDYRILQYMRLEDRSSEFYNIFSYEEGK